MCIKKEKKRKLWKKKKVANFSTSEGNGLGGQPPSFLLSLLTHFPRHSAIIN